MWILLIFGSLMAAYGLLIVGLTYRFGDRGDTVPALLHATVVVVVGGLAASAGLVHTWQTYLIAVFGSLLLGDALARWRFARKRRRDTGE
jgi:membrane protein DedA with SNARE-associated domain